MNSYLQFHNHREKLFYENVCCVVLDFLKHTNLCKNHVLIFPHLNSQGRFFVHKSAENFPGLSSISIGQGVERCVVIYHCKSLDTKGQSRGTRNMSKSSQRDPGKKKPDQARYVPKHRRNVTNANRNETAETTEKNKKKECITEPSTISTLDEEDLLMRRLTLENSKCYKDGESFRNETEHIFAGQLTEIILSSAFQKISKQIKIRKCNVPKKKLKEIQRINENRVLPGIANNLVNLAIENALEFLKSVKTHEKCFLQSKSNILIKNDSAEACSSAPCNKVDNVHDNSSENVSCKKVEHLNDGIIDHLQKEKMKETNSGTSINENKVSNEKKAKSSKAKKKNISKHTGKSKDSDTITEDSEGKSKPRTNKHHSSKLSKKSKKTKTMECQTQEKVATERVEDSNEKPNQDSCVESVKEKKENEIDDWDANWTEDGECLNDEMKKELSLLTGINNPTLNKVEGIDYLNFTPTIRNIELDEGEFGHILELFDFSPCLKTQEIYNALSTAGIKDINLTWVDDTHALAVFASQAAAHTAMKQYIPVLQMRQVVNGTRESKVKARDFKESLLPYKRRPASTAMVARNLVAGALGIRTNVSSEQRKKERDLLKDAKEEKRKKKKQQIDIWENPS